RAAPIAPSPPPLHELFRSQVDLDRATPVDRVERFRQRRDVLRWHAPVRVVRTHLAELREREFCDGAAIARGALQTLVVEQDELADRKSTRLNSSHVKISYA